MAKQELQKLIESLRQKKQSEEQKKWQEEQAKGVMTELQKEQAKALQPVLEGMAKVMTDKMSDEFSKAISSIKVDTPQVNVPEIKVPEIKMPDYPVFNVPQPKVNVNFDASKIRVPEVVMPDMMDVKGIVSLEGVDMEHPLPVTLRDKNGKEVDLATWTTSVISAGGKSDFFTVKGITNTVGVVTVNPDGSPVYGGSSGGAVSVTDIFGTVGTNVVNPDGRLKVELPTGSSGLTDAELRASSVPVIQASDTVFSTKVVSIFGSTITSLLNGDNRIPVSVETGGSGLTDAELRASSVPVEQVSGSIWSTQITIGGNPVSTSNPIPIQPPASGSLVVSGTLTSTGAYLLNGDGTYRDTMPVSGTVAVSGVTGTVGSNIVDSSGVAYSGDNPVPVLISDVGATLNINTVNSITNSIGATILNADGTYRDTFPVSGTVGVSGTVTVDLGANNDVTVTNATAANLKAEVVGTGTFATQENGAALTALQLIDNIVGVEDAPETAGGGLAMAGTVRRDTAASSAGTTGDNATLNTDSLGRLWISGAAVEDAAETAGGILLMVGSVRRDTAASSAGTTGDNATINTDATGRLWTRPQGDVDNDTADTGFPIKIGGVARTANPTAVAGGDRVNASFDDLGRQLIRPVQVRDLISTAYVNKTTGSTFGTETTLFAGATNTYHDLIYVLASNDSTAAIGVDIRGTTGGNILMHLEIPANSTTGLSLPVPLPAGDVGASWTIDLPDVTGTNVYVSALFSKEI